MIEVDDDSTKLVQAVPPKVTPTPLKNLLPVIITAVPPAVAPLEAVTRVTVGAVRSISLRGEEHEDNNKTRHSATVLFLKLYFLQKYLITVHAIKKIFIFNQHKRVITVNALLSSSF